MAVTIGKLKKKLWKLFSLYMKLKYSLDKKNVSCFTCQARLEIGTSNCQLGHWLPKGGYGYHYFTENNCRPQCYRCNIHLSGNTAVFEHNLRRDIGDEAVNKIYETRHISEKRDRIWYEEKIEHYKNLNKPNE